MSSEVHKYTEEALEKKENLFNAEVLNFPNDKKINNSEDVEVNNYSSWKLYDNSNVKEDGDQLKAVTGICFMLGTLFLMGLYSNFL
jgi:hypothetical protein